MVRFQSFLVASGIFPADHPLLDNFDHIPLQSYSNLLARHLINLPFFQIKAMTDSIVSAWYQSAEDRKIELEGFHIRQPQIRMPRKISPVERGRRMFERIEIQAPTQKAQGQGIQLNTEKGIMRTVSNESLKREGMKKVMPRQAQDDQQTRRLRQQLRRRIEARPKR